jgi:hypothetical protein
VTIGQRLAFWAPNTQGTQIFALSADAGLIPGLDIMKKHRKNHWHDLGQNLETVTNIFTNNIQQLSVWVPPCDVIFPLNPSYMHAATSITQASILFSPMICNT